MLELGANSGEKIEMSVLIEGPYGVHCPVERFDSVLLVAGGIGITGIIPYAEYLALSPQYHEIVLLWTVSSVEELTWIDERLQWLSETGKAKIKLYVTRGGTAPKTKEDTVIEDGVAMTELDKSVIMDPPPSFPRHSYETDQMYLVGEGNTKRYSETGEPGMRRKMSFRKHIKSLSQNSIRVDLDQRMENIDGNEMVDWTDYSTHHHHHLRHNSKMAVYIMHKHQLQRKTSQQNTIQRLQTLPSTRPHKHQSSRRRHCHTSLDIGIATLLANARVQF